MILPAALSLRERFELAAEAGFEGIELEVGSGPPAEIRDAADRSGLIVHSVHCRANYAFPLSSGDPAILAAGIKATIEAIRVARQLGADTCSSFRASSPRTRPMERSIAGPAT